MKKIAIFTALLGMLLTSCGDEGQQLLTDVNETGMTDNSSQSDSRHTDIASMPRSFEWKLLSEMTGETDNVVISPLGLEYVLSMAANGASGATRDEIIIKLFSEDSMLDDINAHYGNVSKSFGNLDNSISYVSLNSIWTDDKISVNPGFSSKMKSVYNADTYITSKENMVKEVNNWVNGSTDGRITGLLENPVSFIILNASYLKAEWSLPFSKTSTRQLTFQGSRGSVTTDFMSTFETMDYFGNDIYDIVRKNLGNGQVSFNLILPKESMGIAQCLEELEKKGTNDNWKTGNVSLTMPKFKADFNTSLRDTLVKLGIKAAFDTSADFSEISISPLMIYDIIQSNIIEVDETGLDVSSATAAEFIVSAPDHNFNTALELTADRPFIYYITENNTGAILYYGVISNL